MKATGYFTDEYLKQCRKMSIEQIAQFLEDGRRLQFDETGPMQLISMRVPKRLLAAFKHKAKINDVKYQKRIRDLMRQWVFES